MINNLYFEKYNHLTILLFNIPILKAYFLNCINFFILNLIYLFFGFTYHYTKYKIGKSTFIVKLFRIFDISCIHFISPYLFYKSYFDNINILITILCIFFMIFNYYILPIFFNIDLPHLFLHILGQCAFVFCLNSCYMNKNICDLC